MAASSTNSSSLRCKSCDNSIVSSPITCLVCENSYHESCAKRLKGILIGKCDYVCKKCDNDYLAEVRNLLESEDVSEETKSVVMLLMKIIESKDEMIASKNYYIKLLQNKVANLESKLKEFKMGEEKMS